MPRIRIALCITELDLGGAERCLTEIATRLDRDRFSPVVYCLGPPPEREIASCLPALTAAGLEVHCLGGRGLWQFPAIARRLKQLLLAQNPHIIQTFLFHANILGRIVARRAGVKRVVSGIRVAEHGARWHLWLDRLTQSRVDRYVCVSQAVADFSAARMGLPPQKFLVIPNGIDASRYPARLADLRTFGISPGRRAVVFVGRLESQKGVRWLIETAPLWLAKLPDCDLLMVGDGPLRASLEVAVQTAGVGDRVFFAGWRPDVHEILAASNLLVLPSAWEGMPNVVLEAMATRLPVIASDVEGVRELLGAGAARQTVGFGNTQVLIEKLVSLMSDKASAGAIGQENRHRVEKCFEVSRMVQAYETLWESLANG